MAKWKPGLLSGLLLVAALAGCYGNPAHVDQGLPGGPPGAVPSSGELTQLDSPAALALKVKAPSTVVSWRAGTQFETALPSAHLTQTNNLSVSFAPAGQGAAGIAYGIYSFNLGGLPSAVFKTRWAVSYLIGDATNYFIGLANWNTNRWEWHQLALTGYLNIADASPYQRADGMCLAAVVLPGAEPFTMSNVGFASAALYDEVEPNNSVGEAQPLPPAPLYAFRGSLGKSSGYNAGYDGGTSDYFELTADEGDVLTIGVLPTGPLNFNPSEVIELTCAAGSLSKVALKRAETTYIRGIAYHANQAPYVLRVSALYTDYEIYVINGSAGLEPAVKLAASPASGPAPLTVAFDASGSSDPNPGGSLVRYDWDFDGDGIWEVIAGNDPLMEHTYEADGVYFPRVRVGNALGLGKQDASLPESPGRCTVTVGDMPYDELEDNDGIGPNGFNALPAVPFSGFRGNVGETSQHAGPYYDGDWNDCFTFEATAGVPYAFLDENFVDSNDYSTGSNVMLGILRSEGTVISRINGNEKSVSFVPSVSGQYRLEVSAGSNSGARDYSIRAVNNYPPYNLDLQADVIQGVAPLTVNFTMSAGDPDSGQLSYGWADENTYPDPAYGGASTLQVTYTEPGTHYMVCFVTDETGLRTRQIKPVYVWSHVYEEREPNDEPFIAQELGALPVANFRGSLNGQWAGGFDGSNVDLFRVNPPVAAGQTLRVSLSCSPLDADFVLSLLDKTGAVIATAVPLGGSATVSTVAAAGPQPYLIQLKTAELNKPNVEYVMNVTSL